jgi:single-strand DNA-binding protein
MSESTITVQGYVGSKPVLRTAGEHAVANFRLACTPRRFDRKEQKWVDTATTWFTVSAWRGFGENVAHSIETGDPVIVTGRLVLREWTNAVGEQQSSFEIEATAIGHDLTRTRTVATRRQQASAAESGRSGVAPDPVDEEAANRDAAAAAWALPLGGNDGREVAAA